MVVFKDDPEKYNSPNMYLKIQEQMNNVIELNKKISTMEEGSSDTASVDAFNVTELVLPVYHFRDHADPDVRQEEPSGRC